MSERILRAAEVLRQGEALLVTAGAGMGVDSGLPDFRGPEGFWRAYPAIARRGLSFQEMASPAWFEEDARLAWAFYGHRLNLYRRTAPHAGFAQLLKVGSEMDHGYFVFTSNVDGQFQKAGFAPDRIMECHGSIHHFQCTAPCTENIWDAHLEQVELDESAFQARDPLPKCRHCARLARPNVLMFGDWRWLVGRMHAQEERLTEWLRKLRQMSRRLVVVEVGAGTAIPTVRLTSERVRKQCGGTLIRINPRDSEVPAGQIGLPRNAAEGIRLLTEALQAY